MQLVTHGKLTHATACVLALDREGLLIPFRDGDKPADLTRIHVVDQGADKNVVEVFASQVPGECQTLLRCCQSLCLHM